MWQGGGGRRECLGGCSAEGERQENLSFRIIPAAPLTLPGGSVVSEANPVQHTVLRTTATWLDKACLKSSDLK